MRPLKVGTSVPAASFMARRNGEWQTLDSQRYFQQGTVILCALPGAFTDPEMAAHASRYDELHASLLDNGADAVACLVVNDAEVMQHWAESLGLQRLDLIADGNAEFTSAMGMLQAYTERFLGQRSRRYSLLARDGRIERLFADDTELDTPALRSDADTMLRQLNPAARGPELYGLLTRRGCARSEYARDRLSSQGLNYEEIVVGRDISERALRALSAADETPQVFVSGTLLGDAEALDAYLRESRTLSASSAPRTDH